MEPNQDKIVVINGDETYRINKLVHSSSQSHDSQSNNFQGINLNSYHTINNGYINNSISETVYNYIWCKNTLQVEKQLPPLINLTINNVKQGIWYKQHSNIKFTTRDYYDNGQKQGLWEE